MKRMGVVVVAAVTLFAIPIKADLPTKKILTLAVAKEIAAAAEVEAKKRGSSGYCRGRRWRLSTAPRAAR